MGCDGSPGCCPGFNAQPMATWCIWSPRPIEARRIAVPPLLPAVYRQAPGKYGFGSGEIPEVRFKLSSFWVPYGCDAVLFCFPVGYSTGTDLYLTLLYNNWNFFSSTILHLIIFLMFTFPHNPCYNVPTEVYVGLWQLVTKSGFIGTFAVIPRKN